MITNIYNIDQNQPLIRVLPDVRTFFLSVNHLLTCSLTGPDSVESFEFVLKWLNSLIPAPDNHLEIKEIAQLNVMI